MDQQFEQEPRPKWLPPRASAIYASGDHSETSLTNEYQPSPQRETAAQQAFDRITEQEHNAAQDSSGIILG